MKTQYLYESQPINFLRDKNKIRDCATGELEVFESINKAKKRSREIQKTGKTLRKV